MRQSLVTPPGYPRPAQQALQHPIAESKRRELRDALPPARDPYVCATRAIPRTTCIGSDWESIDVPAFLMASNSPMAGADVVTTARRVGNGDTPTDRGARSEDRKEEEEEAAAVGRPEVRRTTAALWAKAACISARAGGDRTGRHAGTKGREGCSGTVEKRREKTRWKKNAGGIAQYVRERYVCSFL